MGVNTFGGKQLLGPGWYGEVTTRGAHCEIV